MGMPNATARTVIQRYLPSQRMNHAMKTIEATYSPMNGMEPT